MFGSLLGLVEDAVKIVAAPIEIAIDTTRVITKPLGDLAQSAVKEIKQTAEDIVS